MTEGLGDKVKGNIEQAAGKVQEGVGRATGDVDQEAKGEGKQLEGHVTEGKGKVEGALGNAKRNVENAVNDLTS